MRFTGGKGAFKGVMLGAALVLAPLLGAAQGHECIDSSVVLRHKYVSPHGQELRAVAQVVHLDDHGERSASGLVRGHTSKGGKNTLCESSIRSCAKVSRNARRVGYQTFRRVKHFSCGANFVLSVSPHSRSVSRNRRKSAKPPVTNDPLIRGQWAVKKQGLNSAWSRSQGSNSVMVAVIDTGVDYTHPDLAPNVVASLGKNFNGNTDDAMDDNGHGTHVAGTIGALGNNGLGVAGVAWSVQIVPIKFLSATGSGTLADAVKAIDYVNSLKDQGYPIIASNNSWGGGGYSQPLFDAIAASQARDILFVAAAGNEANHNDAYPSYPANYNQILSHVVSVGSFDKYRELSWFSNYGATVDIAAPGEDISSTYPGGQYADLSGTSMATPHVVGGLVLLKSLRPELSGGALKELLLSRAAKNRNLSGSIALSRELNFNRLVR